MLKYPLRLNENETDFVYFSHSEYKTNASGGPQAPGNGGGIVLYMPNSTPGAGYTNGWNNTGTMFQGPIGEYKKGLLQAAGDAINSAEGGFKDIGALRGKMEAAGEKLGNDIANRGGLGALGNQLIGETVGKKLVGSANNFLALTQGKIFNPNVELLYQGPQLRSFVFEFTFVPRSSGEASNVNDIIKEFKTWSAPKEDGFYLKVPHVWHIRYGGRGGNFMNKFKPCAMTSFELQDNGSSDSHYTFVDGVPVSTSIRMTFSEVDIITRKDHEEGGPRGF
jgi:hypothetical protein